MTGNKILCIEDEAEIRQIIVEELNDAGYETIEADSGRSGLAAIMANHPDLVLCDMNMPEMDGNQLLETLRSDHPDHADMPFVFLTAQTDRHSMLNGKKLGADDYLTKPIDFELLLVTLEARLGQVQRMETKKEQQLVKLYKTVSGCAPASVPTSVEGGAANGQALNATARAAPRGDSEKRAKLAWLSNENDGRITAGRLQFIGMDLIKDELGDRWPAFADRVFDIAEKTIEKRISGSDVFSRDEHDNFVICFAQLDQSAGAFKADRIAEEIRQKILGAGDGVAAGCPTIDNRPEPMAAPGTDSHAARACQALSTDTQSIELTFEETQHTESVFDLIMTRLDQASSLSRKAEEATLQDVFESCLIRMRSVELRNSSQTPFTLAVFDDQTQLKIDRLKSARQGGKDLASEIDMLRISKVAEKIYAGSGGSQLVAITELSFATLDNRRHLERLLKIMKSLRESVIAALALKISGIPDDIYPSRLTELANIIRPFCRLIMVELSKPALDTIDPLTMRLPVVACRFETLSEALAKDQEKIRKLVQEAHTKKARFMVHSIPNGEQKVLLTKLGVDLLSTR